MKVLFMIAMVVLFAICFKLYLRVRTVSEDESTSVPQVSEGISPRKPRINTN